MINMDTHKDEELFHALYKDLNSLDEKRKKEHKKYQFRLKTGLIICILALLPVFYIYYPSLNLRNSSSVYEFFSISSAIIFIIYAWIRWPHFYYERKYKSTILPKVANYLGGFSYGAGLIDKNDMEHSKILPYHTEFEQEDYFYGYYEDAKIEFSEITLTYEDIRQNTKIAFHGIAVLVHFQDNFKSHTIVSEDIKGVDKWIKQKLNKLNYANLVDPEFEKLFDVYTNDQIEARYLINPMIIETLKKLNKGKLQFSIYENKIFILLPFDHNLFEPNTDLNKSAFEIQYFIQLKNEIDQILRVIETIYKISYKSLDK